MALSDYFNFAQATEKGRIDYTDITSIPPDDSNKVSLNTVRTISFIVQPPAWNLVSSCFFKIWN